MANGPVVSGTTPLINLAGIGLLDVLPQLYGAMSVPRAVVAEFQATARPSDPQLDALSWLTIEDAVVADPALPNIGPGETAAISLAIAVHARLVLIDGRKARRVATGRGLALAGILSVLLRAMSQGHIAAVKPQIQVMESQGRCFGDKLITDILRAAGEQP